MNEPKLTVGILFAPKIEFELFGTFLCNGQEITGKHVINYDKPEDFPLQSVREDMTLLFTPKNEETDFFELKDVVIGINFHWERKENQRFKGSLKIIVENEKLTAINVISVEDYLTSVISSEMSATASLELLKAHAVISRSWVLAPPNLPKGEEKAGSSTSAHSSDLLTQSPPSGDLGGFPSGRSGGAGLLWFERDAHTNFDVCADDHCQRYQGITRASTEIVKQAIVETYGQVLIYDNKICDARFSKCCGGVFEEFQNCWDDVYHPYLRKTRDYKSDTFLPDLTVENEAQNWIRTSPDAFCNTRDKQILSQVLNNYDQETTDFYRWKVEYSQEELSALILKRSGVDYGEIIDLIPIERGTSGRLVQLKIVGTKQTRIIGKELEIRRTLSESHLYSSAFVVDREFSEGSEIPSKFILTGSGWGHGVGLCQIGAAVMGEEGHSYEKILLHYYIGAKIEKWY